MDQVDDADPDTIRTAPEVALRALALFPAVSLGLDAPRHSILEWLEESGLLSELTPLERAFVDTDHPTLQQKINASWWAERLIVLCWALGLIDQLPPPDQQCDTGPIYDVLPPFAAIAPSDFINGAQLRPDHELSAMAETILAQHWEARNVKLTGTPPRFPVTIGIVQERHYAINWVVGSEGARWDDVTADT